MGLLSSTSLWKIDCQCALTDAAAYDNKGRCRKKNFTTIRLLTKVWPAALRCYALLLQRTFPKRDIKGGDFLRVNCILFWRCSLSHNSSLGSGSTFPAAETATNCLQFSWKKINISNIHPSNAKIKLLEWYSLNLSTSWISIILFIYLIFSGNLC